MSNETEQFVALQAMMEIYAEDPVQFVNDFMGCKPDPWQEDVLKEIFLHKHYAISACTGAGKTTLLSWAILYFLTTRPYAKVICTATKMDQVAQQLWPECHRWIRSSPKLQPFLKWTPTRICFNHPKAENEWAAYQRVARTRTTAGGDRQTEGMAGLHADHLLVIADEASGIEDEAFEAMDGLCTGQYNHFVAAGNPLRSSGRFWSLFNDARFKSWKTKSVSYLEAPRVDREWALRMIATHGEDSPTVQARVFGRFPSKSRVDTCWSNEEIRDAFSRSDRDECTPQDWDAVQIGCDPARFGTDETVYCVRKGLKIVEMVIESRKDGVAVAGQLIGLAKKWALPLETTKTPWKEVPVVIDATGIGSGPVDILNAEGYRVHEIHFGSRAVNDIDFENRITEIWMSDAQRLMRTLAIPEDEILLNQLVTRRYEYTTSGGGRSPRKRLESKDTLRKRGLGSPDRADALMLACADLEVEAGFSDIKLW